jgi:DNA-binding HxlR family transcriptional regulator
MERGWFTNENCSVARTLEVIGERWTMLVLRESFFRVRRFEEFQRNTGAALDRVADRAHGTSRYLTQSWSISNPSGAVYW